ncbi:tyrosine-type recombinase/integrase [Cesiribacter andamanensis]|nr:phage integrase SAM-like domain-containing protein [Cesiribacter andamanensis]
MAYLQQHPTATLKQVKEHFTTKDTTNRHSESLIEAFAEFIQRKASEVTAGTLATYTLAYNDLKEFRPQASTRDISKRFFAEFYSWYKSIGITSDLPTKGKRKREPLSPETVKTRLKKLRAFCNDLYDSNLIEDATYKRFKIGAHLPKGYILSLTPEHLQALQVQEGLTPEQEKARDLFLFQAATGLRLEDARSITAANIQGEFLHITTGKTGTRLTLPLLPQARRILEKWGYDLRRLKVAHNNQKLKRVAELAGLNTLIEVAKGEYKPLYKLIGSHTARKSFVNLAASAGVPLDTIRKAITHSTSAKSFASYYDLSDQIKQQEFAPLAELLPSPLKIAK